MGSPAKSFALRLTSTSSCSSTVVASGLSMAGRSASSQSINLCLRFSSLARFAAVALELDVVGAMERRAVHEVHERLLVSRQPVEGFSRDDDRYRLAVQGDVLRLLLGARLTSSDIRALASCISHVCITHPDYSD